MLGDYSAALVPGFDIDVVKNSRLASWSRDQFVERTGGIGQNDRGDCDAIRDQFAALHIVLHCIDAVERNHSPSRR